MPWGYIWGGRRAQNQISLGEVLQVAKLGGTGHPALGREQGPMAHGGCVCILGLLMYGAVVQRQLLVQHNPGDTSWVL